MLLMVIKLCTNTQLKESFRKCAKAALEDMCEWLKGGGEVAVSSITRYSSIPMIMD